MEYKFQNRYCGNKEIGGLSYHIFIQQKYTIHNETIQNVKERERFITWF